MCFVAYIKSTAVLALLIRHKMNNETWYDKTVKFKIICRTSLDNAVCYDMLDPSPASPVSNVIAITLNGYLKIQQYKVYFAKKLVSCLYWWPFYTHNIFTNLPFYFAATHISRTTLIHTEIGYDSTDFTCTIFRQYWTRVFRLVWRLLHEFSHLKQPLHQITISFILTHG